jgi:hypothetical protein
LCAVYGGLYILRRTVREIMLDGSSYSGVIDSEGQTLTSKHFIASAKYFPNYIENSPEQ